MIPILSPSIVHTQSSDTSTPPGDPPSLLLVAPSAWPLSITAVNSLGLGPIPSSLRALSSLVCNWHSVSGCAGAGGLAHTLESILVDVTNAGHGEAKGGATGAVEKEGGVGRKGGACLVHEDIESTPYLFLPLKVVWGAHQEVLPPARDRRRER